MSTKNSSRRKSFPPLCRRGRHGVGDPRRPSHFCLILLLLAASLSAPHVRTARAAGDGQRNLYAPVKLTRDTPPSGQAAQRPSATPTPAPNVRPRTVRRAPAEPASASPSASPTAPPGAPPPAPPANTTGVSAGSEVSEEVDEDEVVRVDSNLVIVPASVVDNRGRAITDLKLEDFELRVDGEIKPISDLSRAETPVNITLLFDNSASLSAARAFEKQAAVRFFQSLVRPIDRASVYSVSTVPALAQPWTNDVRRLVNTIEHFPAPDGATALYDSVAQAAEYIRPLPGRKVLVLVSDGTDTVSDMSFEEALNRALRAECQVYVVQTGQVEDPNLHNTFSEQQMQKLTGQTGGAVYAPRSIQELDAAFAQLALDISQQYLLSYYPQDTRKDKYFRFISLRVPARPDARVRARKGFYPDAAQAQQAPHPTAAGARPANNSAGAAAARRPEFVAPAAGTQQPAQLRDSLSIRVAEGGNAPGVASSRTSALEDGGAGRKVGPAGPDEDGGTGAASPTNEVTAIPSNEVAVADAPPATRRPSVPTRDTAPAPTPSPTPSRIPAAPPARASEQVTATKNSPVNATAEAPRPKPTVSGGVLNTKAISLPKPTYPPGARSVNATGTVVVEVTISEEGKVIEARAISGHPLLLKAAVSAALLAKFLPARLSGMPVKVAGTIRYTFVNQ